MSAVAGTHDVHVTAMSHILHTWGAALRLLMETTGTRSTLVSHTAAIAIFFSSSLGQQSQCWATWSRCAAFVQSAVASHMGGNRCEQLENPVYTIFAQIPNSSAGSHSHARTHASGHSVTGLSRNPSTRGLPLQEQHRQHLGERACRACPWRTTGMEQQEEQQQGALQQAPPVLQRSAAWQQQQSAQVHASEAMLGPSTSAQLRVLVVDSKAASRLNVTQLLSDCAYRVRVALVPKRQRRFRFCHR